MKLKAYTVVVIFYLPVPYVKSRQGAWFRGFGWQRVVVRKGSIGKLDLGQGIGDGQRGIDLDHKVIDLILKPFDLLMDI